MLHRGLETPLCATNLLESQSDGGQPQHPIDRGTSGTLIAE
jgi:hypothetical protein